MTFDTEDLHFAAYLVMCGHKMYDIQRDADKRKATFILDLPSDEERNKYYLGQATVEPIAFMDNVRRLSAAAKAVR